MKAAIYVHIPFCVTKCRYCSFNSVPLDEKLARRHTGALMAEISGCGIEFEPTSIYIGGGTPTALDPAALLAVISALKEKFNPHYGMELTVEANPGSLGGHDLVALREMGVNRVSLGAQSFKPSELAMLGRGHGPEEVEESVVRLRSAGIGNINVDLIYSLPGQDMDSWSSNLDRAIGLGPDHISLYDLSIDKGTPLYSDFAAGRLDLPSEDTQVDMYLSAVERLTEAGYLRYEISNFARPGFECAHNINYWDQGVYAGFGAGASSHIFGVRTTNIPDIKGYVDTVEAGLSPAGETETPDIAQCEGERMMLGLRKSDGVSLSKFREDFGYELAAKYPGKVDALIADGLLERSGDLLRLTPRGVLVSNRVMAEFF